MPNEEQLQGFRELFESNPASIAGLPSHDAAMAEAVVRGDNVHDIAQEQRTSEAAVWSNLDRIARSIQGKPPVERTETAGLGSDTDPGVTGGYGETGFGSLGNEPPFPTPEEPQE